MPRDALVADSRFLSLVLRHAPGTIGLQLDEQGWADIEALVERTHAHGRPLTRERIEEVVARNDKQRFAFNADGRRIRANQGHSIDVDLGLTAVEPPPVLYHGTASRFLKSIQREGLRPGRRRHVHLSADVDTARGVGARHGVPVVLAVDAQALHADGGVFHRAENGVWLVERVPGRFLTRLPTARQDAPVPGH